MPWASGGQGLHRRTTPAVGSPPGSTAPGADCVRAGSAAVAAVLAPRRAGPSQSPRATPGARSVLLHPRIELEDQLGHLERPLALARGGVRRGGGRRPGGAGSDARDGAAPLERSASLVPLHAGGGVRSAGASARPGRAAGPRRLSRGAGQRTTVTVVPGPDAAAAHHALLPAPAPRRGLYAGRCADRGGSRASRTASRSSRRRSRVGRVNAGGPTLELASGGSFRFNDQARGRGAPAGDGGAPGGREARPRHRALARQLTAPHRFTVTLTHGARDTTAGTVRLQLPRGWPAVAPQPFRFTREDERETFVFDVRAARRGSRRHRRDPRGGAGLAPAGRYDSACSRWTIPTSGPRSYTSRPRPRSASRRWRCRGSPGWATSAARPTGCPRRCAQRGRSGRPC